MIEIFTDTYSSGQQVFIIESDPNMYMTKILTSSTNFELFINRCKAGEFDSYLMVTSTKILKQWEAKLREPNRPQCSGRLERLDEKGNVESQCCMGVLGEVLVENSLAVKGISSARFTAYGDTYAARSASNLSIELLNKAGLTMEDQDYFITMNDTKNATFSDIADKVHKLIGRR